MEKKSSLDWCWLFGCLVMTWLGFDVERASEEGGLPRFSSETKTDTCVDTRLTLRSAPASPRSLFGVVDHPHAGAAPYPSTPPPTHSLTHT